LPVEYTSWTPGQKAAYKRTYPEFAAFLRELNSELMSTKQYGDRDVEFYKWLAERMREASTKWEPAVPVKFVLPPRGHNQVRMKPRAPNWRLDKDRAEVIEQCNKEGWFCYYCNTGLNIVSLTVDHLTPLSRHGGHGLANCVAACYRCNEAKADMTEEEFRTSKKFLNIIREEGRLRQQRAIS
jgi:hypothetical protein